MAKQNQGKNFENWCSKKLKEKDYIVTRYRDVGLVGGRNTKGTQNPCDFHMLKNKQGYYMECKANKADRFSISRLEKVNETTGLSQLDWLKILRDEGGVSVVAIHFWGRRKRVVVELEAIEMHDMRSIKYDDNICWDFHEYFDNEVEAK